jgi:hypothetical protein
MEVRILSRNGRKEVDLYTRLTNQLFALYLTIYTPGAWFLSEYSLRVAERRQYGRTAKGRSVFVTFGLFCSKRHHHGKTPEAGTTPPYAHMKPPPGP